MKYEAFMKMTDEVQSALASGKPVVALESTIISHGFNYPENLETALRCEAIIREHGAVPATIGIRDGKILIGMTAEDIEFFANTKGILKCSRRDVAPVLAMGKSGATTVTTTMMFAQMAGIKVFATGGIGGVHRHGEVTMDISADLEELAHTNVNVVCAGAKSILDLERTKEYLETHGVTILGYRTDAFPDFYTRDSGLKVDYRVDSPEAIAEIIKVRESLDLSGGMLITNPIPEADALDSEEIAVQIEKALKMADEQQIHGKYVTPFLLGQLVTITKGQSVVANKALVFNNAALAADVAKALC